MSNIQKNDNNEKLIDSEKSILEKEDINNNLLDQVNSNKNASNNTNILLNTLVNLTVELGKSKIKIKDFLGFSKGSMLILDKLKKEPLDIFINGHLIASGEIVVLEEKYGLRITSIKNSLENINISV
ncbi:flagellar motor switch protein FliN [Buchnera aphidicola (Hyperomyzus lactucae)]|uniref:Flagellar motor switch protein FliN n=1 Tax=Buchnera aphidicola (Hyperomyzus lactucae) TaxID=1241860 RepID=A0A4D6XVT4_9GAMM|nr:flagellar motor switch protein FliN [Buchnera aphidicola]QCI20823.1 flagellar motor switch protein FliN [Buchnera aphidicola (Hyperomyzus lactucae)]